MTKRLVMEIDSRFLGIGERSLNKDEAELSREQHNEASRHVLVSIGDKEGLLLLTGCNVTPVEPAASGFTLLSTAVE